MSKANIRSFASYRRLVFSIIQDYLMEDKKSKCGATQRCLVIKGLAFICDDNSPESIADTRNALSDVLSFLVDSFDYFLRDTESAYENEENLNRIIVLIRLLSLKSGNFLDVIIRQQSIYEKFIDRVNDFTETQQQLYTRSVVSDMDTLSDIILSSQLTSKLCSYLCEEITTLLDTLTDEWHVGITDQYLLQCSQYVAKVSEAMSSALLCWRHIIKSILLQDKFLITKDEDLLRESSFLSSMVRRCDFNDFNQCSHILKIFIIFGEHPLLSDVVIECFLTELITIFLATMRSGVLSPESILAKIWLLQNICNDVKYRIPILTAEGSLLEIIALMRTSDVNMEGFLSNLWPFRESFFFLDMSLTNSQIIQYFANIFQSDEESIAIRQQAFAVLQMFAEGLKLHQQISSSVKNNFNESGILFGLVNAIGIEDTEDGQFSRNAMATSLLCTLVADDDIRRRFLAEPLGILRCLAASADPFYRKSNVVASLAQIIEVVLDDENTHVRMFENNMMKDLKKIIKDTLLVNEDGVPEYSKVYLIKVCLNIFDIMSSSTEASQRLRSSKFSDFLHVLLQHNDRSIIKAVSGILNKLDGGHQCPNKWKKIFCTNEMKEDSHCDESKREQK